MPKTDYQERQDNFTLGGGAGETNTATNVGTDGLGVFYQKTGVNLEFKHVAPGSNRVTVSASGQDIDVDVIGEFIHVGTSAPGDPALQPLWIDTSGGAGDYRFKLYSGTTWKEMATI